jgi:hypothetical protein
MFVKYLINFKDFMLLNGIFQNIFYFLSQYFVARKFYILKLSPITINIISVEDVKVLW